MCAVSPSRRLLGPHTGTNEKQAAGPPASSSRKTLPENLSRVGLKDFRQGVLPSGQSWGHHICQQRSQGRKPAVQSPCDSVSLLFNLFYKTMACTLYGASLSHRASKASG